MLRHIVSSTLAASLFLLSADAAAQQVKIESQGQAEQNAQHKTAIAKSMAEAVGAPLAGTGQVVFFRAANSPGAGIDVVWPQFLAMFAIGAVFFAVALGRFRRTIGQMA